MAKGKNDGGNGGGKKDEKHLNAESQNEIRRAKKRQQKANSGRGGDRLGMGDRLFDNVAAERKEARTARQQEREQSNREHVARGAIRCLGREASFKGWSETELRFAADYVNALAGLDNDEQSLRGAGLSDDQRRAAQRFFAGAIARAKYPPKGTPGQLADWFAPAYAKAQAAFNREQVRKAKAPEPVLAAVAA